MKFLSSLAILVVLLLAVPASAHPVTPADISRTDWFARGTSEPNIGAIARDTAGRGEFVWSDAPGDHRAGGVVATGTVTREVDLTRFNVTADATNLYFLARVERYTGIQNDPPLQLMISIDKTHGSGATELPDGVATSVSGAAKWDYVVETQFAKGAAGSPSVSAAPKIWTSGGGSSTAGSAQLVSSAQVRQGGFAEIAVPWSAVGGKPASDQEYLRFTVSTYYANHAAPADGIASKAIDAIGTKTTADELSDGTLDYYFDLHFNAAGEVFAPLVISEFNPNPPKNPKGEWIEIFNPNAFAVSLAGYKVGDQPYRGGSQGMLLLPSQSLEAGKTILIVNDKATFLADNPTLPQGALVFDMNALTPYAAWASGKISLQNENKGLSFKESLALLDPSDTIVDMVQYAYSAPLPAAPVSGLDPDNQPIRLTSSSVASNTSYDRCPSTQDTNDSELDFFVHTRANAQDQPTPGAACLTVPGVDLRISKDGPESFDFAANPTVQYIIPFGNSGSTNVTSGVVVTDTLPANVSVSCVSASMTVNGSTTTGCPAPAAPGKTLTWNVGALASRASGVITLTVQFDADPGQDVAVTNTVGIKSTSPSFSVDAAPQNNVATQTLITAGPPDLGVASTWAAQSVSPGEEFSYAIVYGNYGEDNANDITIADQLPAGVTFVGQEAPAGVSFQGAAGGKPTWKISSLAYQEGGTIKVTARLDKSASSGALLGHDLTIASNPADLVPGVGQTEQADREQTALTVGPRKLFVALTLR